MFHMTLKLHLIVDIMGASRPTKHSNYVSLLLSAEDSNVFDTAMLKYYVSHCIN